MSKVLLPVIHQVLPCTLGHGGAWGALTLLHHLVSLGVMCAEQTKEVLCSVAHVAALGAPGTIRHACR